ncbi:diverse immunoglobulin domain-containing protein 2.2 [Rhinichthys klamathensis goyatoka]|uniref:diverse immunoglobulin domain-containing protein 2.2 n=1 Tax=Rhinichthys klamathensis goyatoka TaxID=3034132 RepID=UPI0024B57856|nr:diverse immunoglobulin domain-containing protein 2.2 [Rhinichthys klamathensis goyatoka]
MDEECHLDMLGLMILCSLLTGTSGDTHLHVFSSDGESVSLPCVNALTGCTSTTWMYNRIRLVTVVLFKEGMKNNDTERRERLSLGSDCSLNIYNATTEDHGRYTCRQYVNTQRHTDDSVNLHVLRVSPSSTQTEIRPGRSFSLSCQLYVHDGYSCVDLFYNEGIKLVWKNEADVDLQSDSRYQISFSPEHCNSSLTTTLLNEDDNTEWRCAITKGTKVQTSVRYTVTYLGKKTNTISLPPRMTHKDIFVSPAVTAVAALLPLLALLALIALWFICKKRADKAVISRLTPVTPPAADVHENTDDVAYAEVIISRNKCTERPNVQSDDKVTYAAIGRAKAGGQEEGLLKPV